MEIMSTSSALHLQALGKIWAKAPAQGPPYFMEHQHILENTRAM